MTPPVILGTLSRDGRTVTVRCPYCGGEHTHGAAGIGDGTGAHRLTHCAHPKHAASAGYLIRLAEGQRNG